MSDAPTWREALAERLLLEALDARQSLALLTPRQIEVARYFAKGFPTMEVAQLMGIGKSTVERHTEAALRKLGLQSRIDLAVLVTKAGLS